MIQIVLGASCLCSEKRNLGIKTAYILKPWSKTKNCERRSPGVLYEGTLGSRSIKKALVMHGASIFSMYWGWFLWFMCRKSMSQIFLRIWSFDWCEPFVGAKSVYGKLRFTSFASAPRVSWCLGWVCCGTFQSCITSCLHGSLRAPTQCLEIER